MGVIEGFSIGQYVPSMNLAGIFTSSIAYYAVLSILVFLIGYFVLRILFAPYAVIIFEKVGRAVRFKGRDFGIIKTTSDGTQLMKLMFRKAILPLPQPDYKIVKSKWQNLIMLVQLSEDEFKPIIFNESLKELLPVDQDTKFWAWNAKKKEDLEFLDGSQKWYEKPIFSFALWGVVGMLIIVASGRYGSTIMADATSKSRGMIQDSTTSAANAAGQIASAISSIQLFQTLAPAGSPAQPPPKK